MNDDEEKDNEDNKEKKLSRRDQQNIIKKIQSLESEWDGYEAENVREANEDAEMENGNMWDDAMKADRNGRAMVTINKLTAPVKRISNEFKQNEISIKVTPQESGDKDIAEIRQGLIANIEIVSNAPVIYSSTFDQATKSGFGFFRVLADYKDERSFDQYLKIAMIPNNMAVKMDYRRKWSWGHDAKWCIINDVLSREDFNNQFPDSKLAQENPAAGKYPAEWFSQAGVKIAEFFEINYTQDTLFLLKDGSTQLKSEFKGKQSDIKNDRKTLIPHVHWYKVNITEVLEHTKIPIEYIPVVCMPGEVVWIKDKRYFRSLIRFAKKLNQYYNIHKSNEIERDSLSPKAPYILTADQIAGHEGNWSRANVDNIPYLLINKTDSPFPQRQGYVNNSAGETKLAEEAANDIKTVTGVYDPALGAQSNEVSGVAIRARSGQSQTINYNFHDNAAIAVQYCGLILNSWIPHIYDSEREIRILGVGKKDKIIKLNSSNPKDPKISFDNTIEKYDVSVSTGPAYQTQMQEAFQTIIDLLPNMNDQQKMLSMDLAIGNLNFPNADVMEKRFNKLNQQTFPHILDGEIGNDNDQSNNDNDPEKLKQELNQAKQLLQQTNQAIDQSHQVMSQMQAKIKDLEDKQNKDILIKKIEHDGEMEKARFNADLQMKLKEMDNQSKLDLPLMQSVIQHGTQGITNAGQIPSYVEQDFQNQYAQGQQENTSEMSALQQPEQPMQTEAQQPQQTPEMQDQAPQNVSAQSPSNTPDMEQNVNG